jgi:hypothetical protein
VSGDEPRPPRQPVTTAGVDLRDRSFVKARIAKKNWHDFDTYSAKIAGGPSAARAFTPRAAWRAKGFRQICCAVKLHISHFSITV